MYKNLPIIISGALGIAISKVAVTAPIMDNLSEILSILVQIIILIASLVGIFKGNARKFKLNTRKKKF